MGRGGGATALARALARLLTLLLTLLATVAGALLGLMAVARAALKGLLDPLPQSGWSSLPLDRAIVALAGIALAGCALWIVVVTVATAVEGLTGASCAALRAVSPPVVRRLVLLGCAVTVGSAGVLAPATASEQGLPARSTDTSSADASRPGASALAGLPLPDRMVGGPPPRARKRVAPEPPRRTQRADLVTVAAVEVQRTTQVVRPGDCLWSIAERLLPGADAAGVDAAWRRIHHANRRVIGPDPDLIVPGTTLRIPPLEAGPHRHDRPGELGAPHHRKDAS
jgi:hypothetical protein